MGFKGERTLVKHVADEDVAADGHVLGHGQVRGPLVHHAVALLWEIVCHLQYTTPQPVSTRLHSTTTAIHPMRPPWEAEHPAVPKSWSEIWVS